MMTENVSSCAKVLFSHEKCSDKDFSPGCDLPATWLDKSLARKAISATSTSATQPRWWSCGSSPPRRWAPWSSSNTNTKKQTLNKHTNKQKEKKNIIIIIRWSRWSGGSGFSGPFYTSTQAGRPVCQGGRPGRHFEHDDEDEDGGDGGDHDGGHLPLCQEGRPGGHS